MITNTMLPPKDGYVEIEWKDKRIYRRVPNYVEDTVRALVGSPPLPNFMDADGNEVVDPDLENY